MADKSLFDTSDIDRWIGVPIGGGEIIEDIHINDIRRWAQAMQNPEPAALRQGLGRRAAASAGSSRRSRSR